MGWDHKTYLLADQVDADKAMLAIKTHHGKGRIKFPDPVYRPPRPKEELETPQAQSLDDFDIHALLASMGAG